MEIVLKWMKHRERALKARSPSSSRPGNRFKEKVVKLPKKEQRTRAVKTTEVAMKTGFLPWRWIALLIIAASVLAYADGSSVAAEKSLAKTRLELRQQGFKTDLTNFDFSISPELLAREEILASTITNRRVTPFRDHPVLMEPAASNRAIVIWKQGSLKRPTISWPATSYELSWEDFRQLINQCQRQLDAACAAILSGPIQFDLDASEGSFMKLQHLPFLKNLTQTLNDRAMIALHDGSRDTAWTNLMAATRLVTAWDPEPTEVSHRVRFDDARLVFNAIWQALQTNGWTDSQLASLQHEWESADFLSHLPEIQAFRRASDAQMLERDEAAQKAKMEMSEDENSLLLFYRDREIEFRNAVQAASWAKMREMPGVTNELFFEPKHHSSSRFEMSLRQRRMRMRFEDQGVGFLARAAEAETERRIIVAALVIERFHGKFGHYPEKVQALAPDFLKSPPMDFMTDQPLRYRVSDDNHFLLYSVGLDCVDNGGKMELQPTEEERIARLTNPNASLPESDVVWPLPASPADVTALRDAQAQAEAERKAQREANQKAEALESRERAQEARKAAMKKLLAEKPSLGQEPVYQGKPLSAWVDKVGQIEEYNGAPKDAVEAIRSIGAKAVPFLLEWMPHPGAEHPVEGYPQWSSVEIAWWAVGTNGKSAIPELARIIGRPEHGMDDYSVWTESAKAISYLGSDAIGPMLTIATNMQGKHELWELLHNFKNLGTNGVSAVPVLIHWGNDPDYWVRDGVVSALGGIGKRADLAVPVLMNALEHDANSMVRRDAATALGSFANDSEAVLPELTKLLKDPDWQACGGALSGLGKIQNKPDVVVPLIAPFLYDENNVLQRTAAYALRDLGDEAGYAALLQASNAPSSWPGIGDIIYEVRERTHRDKPH